MMKYLALLAFAFLAFSANAQTDSLPPLSTIMSQKMEVMEAQKKFYVYSNRSANTLMGAGITCLAFTVAGIATLEEDISTVFFLAAGVSLPVGLILAGSHQRKAAEAYRDMHRSR